MLAERRVAMLDAIAKRLIHTSDIGAGSIAKIMHNSASFALDLVMAECWTAGIKAGIVAASPAAVTRGLAAVGADRDQQGRSRATRLFFEMGE